jgi:two-component system sensor histidine kinase QseC
MRTIRARLLATLLFGLTIILLAGGAGVYTVAQTQAMRQFDADLAARAHALAGMATYDKEVYEFEFDNRSDETLSGALYQYWYVNPPTLLRESEDLEELSIPIVIGEQDELIFRDVSLTGGDSGRAAWLRFESYVDVTSPEDEEEDEDEEEEDDTIVFEPPEEIESPLDLVVMVALDRSGVDAAMATLLATLGIVGGAIWFSVIGLLLIGVRWGLAPLRRLQDQVGAIDGEFASSRVDGSGAPGELAPVYAELNRMLDRMESTLDRERLFVNAAAHELRTPLAELRAGAEVALKWPDSQRAEAALRESLQIGQEMESLVESLLLISRGKANGASRSAEQARIAPIVDRCVSRFAQAIEEKHLEVNVSINEHDSITGAAEGVEIIVRNLIDNAVRYCPSNSEIVIRSEPGSNGNSRFVVRNDANGLTPSGADHLFEPFWRADGARTDRNHAGLGLAVVRQIGEAIGLQTNVALEGGVLTLCVEHSDGRVGEDGAR